MSEEAVAVATAADEIGAEMLCGLLRSAGIECGHRVTEQVDSTLHGFAADGPREIVVHADDVEAARALLPAVED